MKLGLWEIGPIGPIRPIRLVGLVGLVSGIPVEGIWLEGHGEASGDLAAGEVVWHGVLNIVYVGNPVIATHVGNVEEVEHVHSQPNALEFAQESACWAVFASHEFVAQSHVNALVGRLTEESFRACAVGRGGWQTCANHTL